MESILEQDRRQHEEKERVKETMKKLILMNKTTLRDNINCDFVTKSLLDKAVQINKSILDLKDDKDGLRREEIQDINVMGDDLKEFYRRLHEIKTFHRKHPDEIFVPMSVEYDQLYKNIESSQTEDPLSLVQFSGEEGYGKYLDLHQLHLKFINLKGAERVSYVQYLDSFHKLNTHPRKFKNKHYKEYVAELLNYLINFYNRLKPLNELHGKFAEADKEFKQKWENGNFIGWGKEAGSAMTHAGAVLDLSAFNSVDDLMLVGLDRLKSALMALSLKCGGTLEQRAERLFSTKGKQPSEFDPSMFAKSKAKKKALSHEEEVTAGLEARVYMIADLLDKQRVETKENIQRRQARSEAEKDEEDDEAASDTDSDEEEEEVIYNPKNLPLGWDGKPIPYWLYKLHGLNINYKCEICGNQNYRGPKAFQRHFSEWRHAHGMRCLGIPNTAHFANVTNINDALSLWNKIKQAKSQERWNPEQDEECEDRDGHVISKRTYNDLMRQGLL